MKSTRFLLSVVVAVILANSGHLCQAQGRSFSSFWPFGKQKTETRQTPVKTAVWPKFNLKPAWPTAQKKNSSNQPSMVNRMAAGSKKMWGDTKRMVSTGSTSLRRKFQSKKSASPSPKKPSMFSRLFKPHAPSRGPQTTQEFLSQDRVKF